MGKLVFGGVPSTWRSFTTSATRGSLVVMVLTEGGLPLLDLAALRKNLKDR
jgi:hypothetical protein